MINKPIGVFDSGLGGLTAVKELIKVLPNEDIIYFGDTGRVPYGNRSQRTIIKYANDDILFLSSLDVKMIIVACGTVSSVINKVGNKLIIPFIGVIEPTAKAAINATRNGKIGIIGTTATIKSGAYQNELKRLNPDIQIFEKDCPMFVPLVENGFIEKGNKAATLIAEKYLKSIKEANIDTLILGCTHYPIISEIITSVIGNEVNLINPGKETAYLAYDMLQRLNLKSTKETPGNHSFYVSDDTHGFEKNASLFLGKNLNEHVTLVDIESYCNI